MKTYFSMFVAFIAMFFAASCSNSDEIMEASSQKAQLATRAVGVKAPKFTVYVETNDVNPLNAGEYLFNGTTEEAVDHVVLFASNIRGTASTAQLYHNPNQTYILEHAAS